MGYCNSLINAAPVQPSYQTMGVGGMEASYIKSQNQMAGAQNMQAALSGGIRRRTKKMKGGQLTFTVPEPSNGGATSNLVAGDGSVANLTKLSLTAGQQARGDCNVSLPSGGGRRKSKRGKNKGKKSRKNKKRKSKSNRKKRTKRTKSRRSRR
jgi:hypothetical protein